MFRVSCNLFVRNVQLKIRGNQDISFRFSQRTYEQQNPGCIEVEDFYGEIENNENNTYISFVQDAEEFKFVIKDCYFKVKNTGEVSYVPAYHITEFDVNGVLIEGDTKKYYFGTNFRDFYVSWKYGTIGLKTLDGVGSAQGSITTAWLEENGWVKKG